jgi:hypothetical protein
MLVDTGSYTVVLPSTLCPANDECGDARLKPTFNVSLPGSRGPLGNGSFDFGPFSSISGSYYSASATLTQNDSTPLGPSISTNLMAISHSANFWDFNVSCVSPGRRLSAWTHGLLGFSLVSSDAFAHSSWLVNYWDQYPDVSHEFTLQLCPLGEGRLWIGYYDPASTSTGGHFQCTPALTTRWGWWVTQLCSLSLRSRILPTDHLVANQSDWGGSCNRSSAQGSCGLVDSGTSNVFFPSAVYRRFVQLLRADIAYRLLFGSEGDPYDPNGAGSCRPSLLHHSPHRMAQLLPTLVVQLPLGSDGPIIGDCASATFDVLMPGVDGYLFRQWDAASDEWTYCPAVITNDEEPITILGAQFMQSLTVRHLVNSSAPQICIAPSKGCTGRSKPEVAST